MTPCRWVCVAALGAALMLGGCSSFEREWKSAAHRPVAGSTARADRFAGAWDGQWTSEKHRLPSGAAAGGRLRCVFTPIDETHYRARFHADWLVFATGYEAIFTAERRGSVLAFRGEHDLGAIFGGVYRYEGRVTAEQFHARFASRSDFGRFEMGRVKR